MLKKVRNRGNSETLKKFQEFMRKRLEKKNILQSNESINKKIQCFEQLLKLTKSGDTLANHTQKEVSEPASRSYKVIGQQKKEECEEYENTQLVLGKLDKMVHDINGWVGSKKTSQYQSLQRKHKVTNKIQPTATPSEERKFKKFDYSSAKVSRINYNANVFQYAPEDVPAGEQRPGYAPNRRKQYIARQNTSRNLQKNKTAVSKTIDLSTKTPDFSSLKNQITEYEARAKQMYGLTFEIIKPKQYAQEVDDLFLMKEQSKEMMRVISLNQFKKSTENPYRQMVKQHTREDSSVPSNFLGMIRSSSAKSRKKIVFTPSASRYIRV